MTPRHAFQIPRCTPEINLPTTLSTFDHGHLCLLLGLAKALTASGASIELNNVESRTYPSPATDTMSAVLQERDNGTMVCLFNYIHILIYTLVLSSD